MPKKVQFSWNTLLRAIDILAKLSHAKFDALMLDLSADSVIPHGSGTNKRNKANELARFAKENPAYQTASGAYLHNEIVEQAKDRVVKLQEASWGEMDDLQHKAFVGALAVDGFKLTDDGKLRKTLPEYVDLPEAENELYMLLEKFNMATPKGHLEQAIESHTRGNWAAANAQLRTFVEGLFNDLHRHLQPADAEKDLKPENRRQKLAIGDPPLFDGLLNEWSQDGKGFINGFYRMLHTEGSHPGLSTDETCTFRLHLTMIVARYYLRKAELLLPPT